MALFDLSIFHPSLNKVNHYSQTLQEKLRKSCFLHNYSRHVVILYESIRGYKQVALFLLRDARFRFISSEYEPYV